jgi:hypothetical protein
MHLIYLGFVRGLCRLLNRTFFKEKELNEHQGEMSTKDWTQLGVDMSRILSPKDWDRYPRDIAQHIKGFKAEELSNFLMHWLLPLTFNRVNTNTYKALQRLVLAISLATSPEIKYAEIEEVEKHLTSFLIWFYNTYHQQHLRRLPVCKYTVHALMHLVRDIRSWGSACYFWQFPEVWPLSVDSLTYQGAALRHSRGCNQISSTRVRKSLCNHAPTPTPQFRTQIWHNSFEEAIGRGVLYSPRL